MVKRTPVPTYRLLSCSSNKQIVSDSFYGTPCIYKVKDISAAFKYPIKSIQQNDELSVTKNYQDINNVGSKFCEKECVISKSCNCLTFNSLYFFIPFCLRVGFCRFVSLIYQALRISQDLQEYTDVKMSCGQSCGQTYMMRGPGL